MSEELLFKQIKNKSSFLCVGLDSDIRKIPRHLLKEKDPIFTFNKAIIDATSDLCIAYKPNIAFYEKDGVKGWETLQKTIEYIPEEILTIADAKRGDIGNTASMYARTFFDTYQFDAVTVAPYMGEDSIAPFLDYKDKWTILLALTSNPGSGDFQMLTVEGSEERLFEKVLETSRSWQNSDRLMYVVGATQTQLLSRIREIIPDRFLLVPGVGAQGGSLEEVIEHGMNKQCGLIVNSSRGILYAGDGITFDQDARKAALEIQQKMELAISGL